MEIIRSHLHGPAPESGTAVAVAADRATLAKRRWRGEAEDGREFGFDLDHALGDGDVILRDGDRHYFIRQLPEAVLEIRAGPDGAAKLAWQIGNLHFPAEISGSLIRVSDDPAIRQMLDREGVAYAAVSAVFRPLSAAAHGHSHAH